MYEYISVFINNLEIVVKDTKILMDALGIMYKFKLEGTETTTFHVGCDLFRESDGVLWFYPQKYVDKVVQTYMTMFGSNTKLKMSVRSPL